MKNAKSDNTFINLNADSVFRLKPITDAEINQKAQLFIHSTDNKATTFAFKTVRDQLIFCHDRLIILNVQGVGVQKLTTIIPYRRILYYSVQTPDVLRKMILPDVSLILYFENGFHVQFDFTEDVDIRMLTAMLDRCMCIPAN